MNIAKRAQLPRPNVHYYFSNKLELYNQALMEIADFLELSPAEVIDTASFYEEYWLKPKGDHVIWVCRSIASSASSRSAISPTTSPGWSGKAAREISQGSPVAARGAGGMHWPTVTNSIGAAIRIGTCRACSN